MPDTKITALAAITTVAPANDLFPIVDVSDNSMAASGTTKNITVNQLLGAGGTATLASATITGALTVNGGVNLANATAVNFGGLLTIYSDTAAGLFIRGRTTGGTTFQTQDGTNPLLNITNAGVFTFSDGAGGTRMTLNSTGLGVGYVPSGSADKLGSAATLGVIATGSTADLNFRNSSLTSIQRIRYTDGTGVLTIGSATGTAYPVELGGDTGGRAVIIDGSKNVGVGVTPSAWRNTQRALQIGAVGAYFSSAASTGSTCIGRNVYESAAGDFTYIVNDEATFYEQTATGTHAWYTAAAGTGTISFGSAKMTLDQSGNLLLGTVTPSSLIGGSGAITAKGIAGILSVNVTALSTNFTLPIGAFSGILVIRSNGGGGSAVWMLDPNAGAVSISNNIAGRTITFTFSGGAWQLQQTVGTVPSLYNYNVIATQ